MRNRPTGSGTSQRLSCWCHSRNSAQQSTSPSTVSSTTSNLNGAQCELHYRSNSHDSPTEFRPQSFPPSYVWMYGSFVADVFITSAMIFYLQRMKDSTVFDRTRSVVNRMCILTFETNALTGLCEVIVAALLQVRKDGWGPCFNFCLVKLYTISLLVSLNSRKAANAKGPMSTGINSNFASNFNKANNTMEMQRSRGIVRLFLILFLSI